MTPGGQWFGGRWGGGGSLVLSKELDMIRQTRAGGWA